MSRLQTVAVASLIVVGILSWSPSAVVSGAGQAQPPSAAAAPANPNLERYKRDVGLEVDSMREDIARMNDQVFSFAELGFQEFETVKYLTDILKKNGFTI